MRNLVPNVDPGKLSQLLSCAHALVTEEAVSLGLPDFPLDNLPSAAVIMVNILSLCTLDVELTSTLSQDKCPHLSVFDIIYRFYPYKLFLGKEGQSAVEDILSTFNVLKSAKTGVTKRVTVSKGTNDSSSVTIQHDNIKTSLNVSVIRKRRTNRNVFV